MGVFWKYFSETLRWPLLFVGGPLAVLVKGAAGSLDQARQDILWLREQFSPETCADEFLETHGRARGLRRQQIEDTERFRARVANAFAWSLLGGREQGLSKILEHYGYQGVTVPSLRQEDPERWAEFRLLHDSGARLVEADYALLRWTVNDQKRATAKLAALRLAREAEGIAAAVGAVHLGAYLTIDSEP